jgi:dihydroorotase
MEFDTAKNGTIGLESAFGALLTELHLETVIEKLTSGRAIFGIESNTITEGSKANFTFFNPEGTSTFTKENILSKSKNSAFLGTEIKGSVYGILNQNQLVIIK